MDLGWKLTSEMNQEFGIILWTLCPQSKTNKYLTFLEVGQVS
jgi:hypothetical protein